MWPTDCQFSFGQSGQNSHPEEMARLPKILVENSHPWNNDRTIPEQQKRQDPK